MLPIESPANQYFVMTQDFVVEVNPGETAVFNYGDKIRAKGKSSDGVTGIKVYTQTNVQARNVTVPWEVIAPWGTDLTTYVNPVEPIFEPNPVDLDPNPSPPQLIDDVSAPPIIPIVDTDDELNGGNGIVAPESKPQPSNASVGSGISAKYAIGGIAVLVVGYFIYKSLKK